MNNGAALAAILAGALVMPVGGGIVGYYVGGKKWWAAVAGALAGIAFNAVTGIATAAVVDKA